MRAAATYRKRALVVWVGLMLFTGARASPGSFAVMPIDAVRFREGRAATFYSAFVTALMGYGHSVVDIGNIHKILRAQELNLSEAVGDSTKRKEVGGILQVKYLLSASFVWNGEYTLATVAVDDVSLGTVAFQKYYMTHSSVEAIALEGIREIVAQIHGHTTSSKIWNQEADYVQSDFASSIVTWARSLRASRICLLYAGVSIIEQSISESRYTNAVKAEVLKTYTDLERSGEYVFQYHLGSYELLIDYESLDRKPKYKLKRLLSASVNYEVVDFLLDDPNTVAVFFGTTEEASLAMNELDRQQRTRFWHAMIWK